MTKEMSRRKFIQHSICIVATGSALTLIWEGCGAYGNDDGGSTVTGPSEPLILDLNDPQYAALGTVGGAVKVAISGQLPLIITRVDASTYLAFSSRCTHQGCEVPLPDTQGIIQCPCHGSRYNIRGQVIRGPAERDLARAQVSAEEDSLKIER